MILPPNFFEWINIDLCYLSRSRGYGRSSPRYIMVITCGLSLYTYYAPCTSTKSQNVIQSFQSVFDRSRWLPEKAKKCFGDKGVEWENHAVKAYLRSNGIRFMPLHQEGELKGRGRVAETLSRKLRSGV